MRIAISTLSGVGYGGLTYFRNFLPALASIDKHNDYILFVLEQNWDDFYVNQDNFHYIRCGGPLKTTLFRFLWEQVVLPIKLKIMKVDIIFTAKNLNIFLTPLRSVIAIRNMEPFCFRSYKNSLKRNLASFIRQQLTEISLAKADAVIAVSDFTKNFLLERYPHNAKKICLVYNGNPASKRLKGGTEECSKSEEYLLTSSKFVAYANQLNLLKGYALLKKSASNLPDLWMAGGILDKEYFGRVNRFISEKGLQGKVKILGWLPHQKLLRLYEGACGFIFPSTLEACPQTLIEAMSCGVPIASSNVGPMPEICQNAAVYFNPDDPNDIAEKIKILLNDTDKRKQLMEAGLERARFFDWEKTARQTLSVIEKAGAQIRIL